MARARNFPIGLTIATVISFVVLCGLGTWQVQRLQWKEDLIATSAAAATLPPASIEVLEREGSPLYRKAEIVCPGLASAPYVELQSIDPDGQPGVRLISACKPAGSSRTYLLDRGFIVDTVSARPAEVFATTPTPVTVELRRTPRPRAVDAPPEGRHFYGRNAAAMAEALRVNGAVAPVTLFALTSSNPEFGALRPYAPPAAFSNNHLGYALTWYGLAAALLAVYIALLLRQLRPRATQAKDPS